MEDPSEHQIQITDHEGNEIALLDFTKEEYDRIVRAALTEFITNLLKEKLKTEQEL